MSPPKPPRASTIPDRDACSPKTVTPPKGHAVYPQLLHVADLAAPHHVEDKVTGVLEGPAALAEREKRPTNERLGHVELRVDAVVKDMGEVKGDVKGIKEMLARDIEDRRTERALAAQRELGERQIRAQTETNQVGLEKVRINGRTKIIVAIVGAITALVTALTTLAATGKL